MKMVSGSSTVFAVSDPSNLAPRTDGLGMTDRTRQILDTVLNGNSVLQPDR